MKCIKCGLPYFGQSVMGYVGPVCRCFPADSRVQGCQPLKQLTEQDIRRIVREELTKGITKEGGAG